MKNKKVFSGILLSAVLVAQAVMPTLAADQGGFDVDLETETGIIRVAVPTTLAIAVDQFEQKSQSQIYSGQFDITNKSNVDVKITVDSTVTVNGNVELVETAAKVAESTDKKGDVWLGVAALTADSSYDDSKTTDATETLATLTDTNANVASFDTATKKASQTFYLGKGAGSDASLKVMNVNTDKDNVLSYAQLYKLTEETITVDSSTENTQLQALVDDHDVYVVTAGDLTDNTKDQTALDVTVLAKGTASVTWANTNKYYNVADVVTAAGSVDADTQYLYKEMAEGGKAGFSYIGKLSSDKETWTKADISNIAIAYTITGVTGPNYQKLVTDNALTYGLYADPAKAPGIATTEYDYDRTQDLAIPVDLGSGNKAAENVASVSWSATETGSYSEFAKDTKWTYADNTLTFKQGTWGSKEVGDKAYLKVTFDDEAPTSVVLTLTISK